MPSTSNQLETELHILIGRNVLYCIYSVCMVEEISNIKISLAITRTLEMCLPYSGKSWWEKLFANSAI